MYWRHRKGLLSTFPSKYLIKSNVALEIHASEPPQRRLERRCSGIEEVVATMTSPCHFAVENPASGGVVGEEDMVCAHDAVGPFDVIVVERMVEYFFLGIGVNATIVVQRKRMACVNGQGLNPFRPRYFRTIHTFSGDIETRQVFHINVITRQRRCVFQWIFHTISDSFCPYHTVIDVDHGNQIISDGMKSYLVVCNGIKESCQIKLIIFVGTWQIDFGIDAIKLVRMMLPWLRCKDSTTNWKSCV